MTDPGTTQGITTKTQVVRKRPIEDDPCLGRSLPVYPLLDGSFLILGQEGWEVGLTKSVGVHIIHVILYSPPSLMKTDQTRVFQKTSFTKTYSVILLSRRIWKRGFLRDPSIFSVFRLETNQTPISDFLGWVSSLKRVKRNEVLSIYVRK